MAGILNSKTRIMDTIITAEGRRQLGRGNFRPEFASFTDGQAFYEKDAVSGSTDATDRFLFEAVSLPADKIFLEYDDSGRLLGSADTKVTSVGVGIFSGSNDGSFNLADSNNFASLSETLIAGGITNFNRHSLLGTHVPNEYNDFSFDMSRESIEFTIDNITPFERLPNDVSLELSAMQPFMHDKKLSHLPQFQYLPPVRRDGRQISEYVDLNDPEIQTFDDLIDEIGEIPTENIETEQEKNIEALFGKLEDSFVNAAKKNRPPNTGKPREVVKFLDTTLSNNMFAQCFEVNTSNNSNSLEKLSVIDFGVFRDPSDKTRPDKQIYFVGKVREGVGGLPTFINLFTLIFD